ncbi:integrase, catalytic region, zinc finger, CCHC-type containing protein [Tanacetum coccineum]
MPNNSQGKKQEVEDQRRNFKFLNNKTSVTACNDSLNAKTSNLNFVYVIYGKCVLNDNHDMCVLYYINGVNSRTKQPIAVPISTREPKRTINQSVATSHKKTVATEPIVKKPKNTTRKLYEHVSKTCSWWYPKFIPTRYKWKPKSPIGNVNINVSIPLGNASRTANILEPMTPRCSTMSNTPLSSNSFAARTVKFENDQIAPILGYRDLIQGKITIKRVYYVEGLNHNLFFVGQFCDVDLEVAFRKSTCYIRDLKRNDLLTATSSQAWLWHRRLSHLNFDTINLLSKNDIVTGLPNLKFVKDHLCSSCELGLHAQVRTVRTDKGIKFLNKTLHEYFAQEGIEHQTSTTKTPEQNGVVERRNRTLVEAARIMLSAAKVPLYFWDEAIAIAYRENLDKMKENGDACIFVGYSTQSRAYRVYNKRTKVIVKTIHVNFDNLPLMASDHVSSDPVPKCQTTALAHDSLSPGPQSQENVPHVAETVTTSNEMDLLFSLMFDELLNGTTQVVLKSFAVTATDAPNKRQQQHTTPSTLTTIAADTPPLNLQTTPETTSQAPTQVPTITANENIIQAETNKEYA